MKRIYLLLTFLIFITAVHAQEKPKLVVGIIVDQMRQEYLYRFENKFTNEGFKKLMKDGYMFKNAHFNYMPTYTAPGHSSVYTGTTPAIHGIIGNHFYDKETNTTIYCADDLNENTVGSSSDQGKMSPRRLLTTTIGDELKLFSQKRSRVIGISIKDRGAIFPAGHMGEAFWFDKKTGNFITSTYYMGKLPKWVDQFNKRKLADHYLKQVWTPAQDLDSYQESMSDDNQYEQAFNKDAVVFPYALQSGEYWQIPETPFGNDMVKDMSINAIEHTDLGQDNDTDLLAISFSSTDYVGHAFGPDSKEVEDLYIRLDKNIAEIIRALDEKIGEGNYTIFLTADHAVAEVPDYLIDNKVPAGYFDQSQAKNLNDAISKKFGAGAWIEDVSNYQVFLNHETVENNNADLFAVEDFVAAELLKLDGVARSYPAYLINGMDYNAGGIKGYIVRGYNQKRSGDVMVVFESGWMERSERGSTHGSPYKYDTHVPVIWYGNGIKQGQSAEYISTTQIAPTISMMLNIKIPSGATGEPLVELLNR